VKKEVEEKKNEKKTDDKSPKAETNTV